MTISHEEVERILRLLDTSHFDELTLETDGVKLTLRRNGAPPHETPGPAPAPAYERRATPREPLRAAVSLGAGGSATRGAASRTDANLIDICAPMLGTFYRTPNPGAEKFVEVGMRVERDTVVGVIEVMKLMNAVPAGLCGEVVDVQAQDGDLVEFEQVLMRVRPL